MALVWAVLPSLPVVASEGAGPTSPSEAEVPYRVLFLGNSYTYFHEMPSIVEALGAAARPPVHIVTAQHTPGGATLEQHAASRQVARKIREGPWDRVVLQEQSRRPILDPDRMAAAAERLAGRIRAAGAEPLLYLTWPRRASPSTGSAIEAAYRRTAAAIGAPVAPVGSVWAEVRAAAGIELYDSDGSHPSAAGSFLAACVLYGALTGGAPAALPDRLPEGLSRNEALVLLGVARAALAEPAEEAAALR